MKTILVSFLLAVTASTASAQKPRPATKPAAQEKTAAKRPSFGDGYELKGRSSSGPRVVDTSMVRSLSERPNRVLGDRLDDLEVCWLRLPASKRVTSAATLRVTIEAAGHVTAARVDGELPAGVGKCITAAAGRWSFPVADTRAEVEHGITLTTR
jgi:hypothetical protein